MLLILTRFQGTTGNTSMIIPFFESFREQIINSSPPWHLQHLRIIVRRVHPVSRRINSRQVHRSIAAHRLKKKRRLEMSGAHVAQMLMIVAKNMMGLWKSYSTWIDIHGLNMIKCLILQNVDVSKIWSLRWIIFWVCHAAPKSQVV